MSSYDIPSARQDRMKDTVKRVPLIVGLPPKRSGFVTSKRYPGIAVSSMGGPPLKTILESEARCTSHRRAGPAAPGTLGRTFRGDSRRARPSSERDERRENGGGRFREVRESDTSGATPEMAPDEDRKSTRLNSS